jgi:hypothetical protein
MIFSLTAVLFFDILEKIKAMEFALDRPGSAGADDSYSPYHEGGSFFMP